MRPTAPGCTLNERTNQMTTTLKSLADLRITPEMRFAAAVEAVRDLIYKGIVYNQPGFRSQYELDNELWKLPARVRLDPVVAALRWMLPPRKKVAA